MYWDVRKYRLVAENRELKLCKRLFAAVVTKLTRIPPA
jgi:hypothetical protein